MAKGEELMCEKSLGPRSMAKTEAAKQLYEEGKDEKLDNLVLAPMLHSEGGGTRGLENA